MELWVKKRKSLPIVGSFINYRKTSLLIIYKDSLYNFEYSSVKEVKPIML